MSLSIKMRKRARWVKKIKDEDREKNERNQWPKGDVWSVITFALLCMIVNLVEKCRSKRGKSPQEHRLIHLMGLIQGL